MKVLKWIDKNAEVVICSAALVGLFICMVLSVFFRYVLNDSLTWAEELGCYLFCWFSLVGVAYSTKNESHLRVDVLVTIAPPPVRAVMNFIAELSLTMFFLYMSIVGTGAIRDIIENGTTSPAIKMPMWLLYLSFWLGCVLSLVRLVQSWIRKIRNNKNKGKEEVSNAG